jgi:DNA-binding NarL/FixJ family response regulator
MTEGQEIVRRLDSLIRLVAAGVCANKSQRDSIAILNSAGLTPKEIAEFLQTTSNTVSVTLSALRKQKSAKKASGPKALPYIQPDDTGSE